MSLTKSLLLGTAAGFAVVAGAQAADLPSRKAAPANYVQICDAYGAGFYTIPGTDTCLRVGGYVRAEWQYTPGNTMITVGSAVPAGGAAIAVPAAVVVNAVNVANPIVPAAVLVGAGAPVAANGAFASVAQIGGAMDSTGTEVRGRVDLDARTPTAMGTVRTAVRLRAANVSGIRGAPNVNNATVGVNVASATAITIEQAMVQWAGFTFGVAPENYAFMPSIFYTANAWAGFPNGMKQLAYTATFGGGFSATIAIEDRTDFGYAASTFTHTPANGYHLVGNIRVDQSWGWAVLHGMVGNQSLREDFATQNIAGGGFGNSIVPGGPLGNIFVTTGANTPLAGSTTKAGYSIGGTVKINLPMIAAGDAVWFTANYADGLLGGLLSNGGLSQLANASGRRLLGGIQRTDNGLVITSGGSLATGCSAAFPCTIGSVKGFNVGAAFTHYWTPQWRSNFKASYVQLNPPTVNSNVGQGVSAAGNTAAMTWGRGTAWEAAASIIYSPAKDFDIGFEVQYMQNRNQVQNPTANFLAQGSPGLNNSGWSTHLRVERQF